MNRAGPSSSDPTPPDSPPRPALDYARPAPRPVSRRLLLRGALSACGIAIVAGVYEFLDRDRPVPAVAPSVPARQAAVAAPSPPKIDVDQVYQSSIVPLLAEFDARNLAAAQRAMNTLHERIAAHRAGIEPFTHDITSWKTRFGVIGRYSEDAWSKVRGSPRSSSHVRAYVDEKFRRHILSEQGLEADVTAVLQQFDDDMAASRNQLYADLSLPLSRIRSALPGRDLSPDKFRDDVNERAGVITRALPVDSVVSGLAALAGGWVATDAAQAITTRVVTQILTQVGTAMAAEGIEAGGATAGGAVAGGGTGSFGGPAGTIIGVGIGIIAGAIVDWWLSKKFRQKVADQCNRFLDTIEQRLRDGGPNAPGLWAALVQTVNLTAQSQWQAIQDALHQEK